MTKESLLSVRGLSLQVAHRGIDVVRDVSFDIEAGEIFGIVGESGSGKTLATRALISLLPPAVRVTGGTVSYKGRNVLAMSDSARPRIIDTMLRRVAPRATRTPISRVRLETA